jgi:DNA gyrase subunit B
MNAGVIAARLRELAWLNPPLELTFCDSRSHRFQEPSGLRAFLARLRGHGGATIGKSLQIDAAGGVVRVEVAAEWVPAAWSRSIESFANSNRTTSDGTHVDGLFDGLISELRSRLPDLCHGRPSSKLRELVAEGMHAVVCVRLCDPTFDQPTRSRLTTPEAKSCVAAAVRPAFAELLDAEASLEGHFREKLSLVGPG